VLGQRIRRARERSGLSIRELAERAQVSKNTVLRIEQGLGSHESTISLLCRALGLSAAEIIGKKFSEPTVVAVHYKEDERWYDLEKYHHIEANDELDAQQQKSPSVIAFTHLKSRLDHEGFTPHLIDLNHATEARSHRGTEFVMVLAGRARICFDETCYELGPEESICFWAAERHAYEPVPGEPVRLLSIVLDPFPDLIVDKKDKPIRRSTVK